MMIYVKIKSDLYNETETKKIEKDYPFYSDRLQAVLRVVKNELARTLKDYPDINVYITTKKVKQVLGRFTNRYRKEYKAQKNEPYIILYWYSIAIYYYRHNVKGLKKVLLHEYIHYKQWLLNERRGHYSGLKSSERAGNTENELKYLYKAVKTGV